MRGIKWQEVKALFLEHGDLSIGDLLRLDNTLPSHTIGMFLYQKLEDGELEIVREIKKKNGKKVNVYRLANLAMEQVVYSNDIEYSPCYSGARYNVVKDGNITRYRLNG